VTTPTSSLAICGNVLCGKSFRPKTRNHRFCSNRCCQANYTERPFDPAEKRICPVCGEENQRQLNSLYCGDKCSNIAQRTRKRATLTPPPPTPDLTTCAYILCNVQFKPRDHNHRFCSKQCRITSYNWRNSDPVANQTCQVCGGENHRRGSRYCSNRCSKRAYAAGKNSPDNWRAQLIREHKEGRPCADCHVPYPYYVMQFDHVPGRGPKRFMLSGRNLGVYSERDIREEIAKCDVVCANCHMIRTHTRNHATKTPSIPQA
jgi:predicted nucleic acid-binding Zn ribbon protein